MINDEQLAAAEKAIREFRWAVHDLPEVDQAFAFSPDKTTWITALARVVLQSQRGVPRWQPTEPTTALVDR